MESIIKKAIEGGYKPSEIYLEETAYGADYQFHAISTDPLFFQALGKACGWDKTMSGTKVTGKIYQHRWIMPSTSARRTSMQGLQEMESPIYFALRFYEINLTEGWEKAVAYLQEVTNPN